MAEPLAKAPTPKLPTGRLGFEDVMGVQKPYREMKAEIGGMLGAAEADIAESKQRQAEIKAEGLAQAGERRAGAERMAQERFETKMREEPLPAFVPTKDTIQDVAALFSLIGVIGMVVGGGGKGNALAAQAAMNGMLDGWQKGRSDLYSRERNEFDKNFKAMVAKHNEFRKEMEDAVKLAQTDYNAGLQAAELAAAKAGSEVVQAQLRKGEFLNAYNVVNESQAGVTKAIEFEQKARQEEERQRQRELDRQQREAAAQQRHQEAMARLEAADRRFLAAQTAKAEAGEKKKEGKPLSDKQVTTIEGMDSLASGLEKLKRDFKPEFASLGVMGFGADMELEARRRLGDEKGRQLVKWWSEYQRLQAPNRHALFGATLTGNELKNYQSFTAKPSDSPDVVKDMLQSQIDYAGSTADSRRLAFEQAGYRVPDVKPRDFSSTYGGGAGAAPAAGVDVAQERSAAKAAIAAGKDEAAVRARFKERTGQEL